MKNSVERNANLDRKVNSRIVLTVSETGLYSIKNLKLFDIQSPKYKEKLCVTKLKYIV